MDSLVDSLVDTWKVSGKKKRAFSSLFVIIPLRYEIVWIVWIVWIVFQEAIGK